VTAEWDGGWRNARNSDPGTSHDAAAAIDQAHLLIVHGHMAAWDRPEGWTYGEVWDATGRAIDNPVEVMRRMSDLHRDGYLCWATGADGEIIKRVWPRTRRPQQARRLYRGPVVAAPPRTLAAGDRAMAISELAAMAAWLHRCGESMAARHLDRAIRKLGEADG
jgi:hypothetical protein